MQLFLSEHDADICLLNETAAFVRSFPKIRELFATKRTARLCPQGHSVRSAAPTGYCHTPSFCDQTSEARVGLPLAHATLDRVT